VAIFTGNKQPESLAALWRTTESWRELYDLYRAYYYSNGLYDEVINQMLHISDVNIATPEMKALRNPAHRAVEFYPAKLWPGPLPKALPIETENEALKAAVDRIWTWSNWEARKQVAARWLALYGDLFLRVAEGNGSVYFQVVDPRYVPDFEEDDRGFLTYFRMDVPQVVVEEDGDEKERTFTEEFNKDAGQYRAWMHTKGYSANVDSLGDPDSELSIEDAFGINFIPVTHAKFQDIGEERGQSCFGPCIDKIDEANRMVTRLHGLLFRHNKPDKSLEAEGSMMDKSGRPMPPPKLGDDATTVKTRLDQEQVYKLPAGWRLRNLVPDIRYEAALSILQDHMAELERDLPELAWKRIREDAREISGRALRYLLEDAIARVKEARSNAEAALVRANQMAVTVGQVADLEEFEGVGTYETGALDHRFRARPVIELGESDRADIYKSYRDSGLSVEAAMTLAGIPRDTIDRVLEMEEAAEENQQNALARSILDAQRQFSQRGALSPEEQGQG
jgi:hypothetical protein